jgi:hypothetical protein
MSSPWRLSNSCPTRRSRLSSLAPRIDSTMPDSQPIHPSQRLLCAHSSWLLLTPMTGQRSFTSSLHLAGPMLYQGYSLTVRCGYPNSIAILQSSPILQRHHLGYSHHPSRLRRIVLPTSITSPNSSRLFPSSQLSLFRPFSVTS